MSWTQQLMDQFVRQRKRYEKKQPRELLAIERNLDIYFQTLISGQKPAQIHFGFLHTKYRLGIVSIDQKGMGKNLAQTRLYVYPDKMNQIVWLLSLGDKQTQQKDVQICYEIVSQLIDQTQVDPTEMEADPDETKNDTDN